MVVPAGQIFVAMPDPQALIAHLWRSAGSVVPSRVKMFPVLH